MAPEQITAPDVEAPSLDVYSYCALMYRALTGRPPFVASDLRTLADLHLHALPLPPDQVRAGVPRSVSGVVLGMLAKKPGDRPTLREVATELARVDPGGWDQILPDAQAVKSPSRAAPVAVDQPATVGGGTEHEPESETGTNAPVAPRVPPIDEGPTVELEQPVFRPKRTRRRYRAIAVAGGILVGLALGLEVLLLI